MNFAITLTRAKSSSGTCDEVGRAKSSYGMSSSKNLIISRLFKKENKRLNAGQDLQ